MTADFTRIIIRDKALTSLKDNIILHGCQNAVKGFLFSRFFHLSTKIKMPVCIDD